MSLNTQDNSELPGLLDTIHGVARAARNGSTGDVNDALTMFARVAFPALRSFIRGALRRRQSGGPGGLIEDADDILQRLLIKIAKVARTCRAEDDEAARNWLEKIVLNETRDATKTGRRRKKRFTERLREYLPGYSGHCDSPARQLREPFEK